MGYPKKTPEIPFFIIVIALVVFLFQKYPITVIFIVGVLITIFALNSKSQLKNHKKTFKKKNDESKAFKKKELLEKSNFKNIKLKILKSDESSKLVKDSSKIQNKQKMINAAFNKMNDFKSEAKLRMKNPYEDNDKFFAFLKNDLDEITNLNYEYNLLKRGKKYAEFEKQYDLERNKITSYEGRKNAVLEKSITAYSLSILRPWQIKEAKFNYNKFKKEKNQTESIWNKNKKVLVDFDVLGLIDDEVIEQISDDIIKFGKDINGIKLFKHKLLEKYTFSENQTDSLEESNLSIKSFDKIIENASSYIYGLDLRNEKLLKSIKKRHSEDLINRKCEVCGTTFKPVCIHPKLYHKNVCLTCPIIENANKDKIKKTLFEIKNKFGFIPIDGSFYLFESSLASQFTMLQWPEFVKLYAKTGGIKNINKHYGSFFECLVETGILPNGILKTSRGYKCLAKDGTVCLSLAEQRITNWLIDNKIQFEKEPKYPYDKELNPNNLMRADWKINNHFIEYFGLKGVVEYDNKTNKKIKLCKKNKIPLTSIFPSDITKLDEILYKFNAYSSNN